MKAMKNLAYGIVGLAAMSAASAFAAGLPEGYTEVEYVEATGSQYVDTGIVPKTTTRLVCDFQLTTTPSDRVRSGWGSAGSVEAFWFGTDNDHVNFACSVSGNSVQANTGVPVDTNRHSFDISMSAIEFDGTNVVNPASAFTDAASGKTMYLFSSRQGWNPNLGPCAYMRIYSCQIYDGVTLVRDFVPAVRGSDDKAGLYDRATDAFFVNSGSGNLTAGPEKPAGDYYVGVEYIESDGNQYIDTLWTNGNSHVVTLNVQPTAVPTTTGTGTGGILTYYGCRAGSQTQNISMFLDYVNSKPSFNLDFNNGNYQTYRQIVGGVSAANRYVLVDSAAARVVTCYDANGDVVSSVSNTANCTATFSGAGSAYLFAINDMSSGSPALLWTNKALMKFYGATVEAVGGTQCCNLVPCLKNGSEPGVYDTVRDLFLPNSGSGSFTYGAATGIVYGDDSGGGGSITPPANGVRIPEGYTEIEYIKGNGSDARIVTDYIPNPATDKIEAVFQFPPSTLANGVNHAIWCARTDGSANTWTLFVLDTLYRFDYSTTQNKVSGAAINTTEKYTVTADGNLFSSSGSNGSSHSSSPAAVAGFTSTVMPLVLFSSYTTNTGNNKTNYGKHRLYSFKVWRSDELIHYFVPCKDPSGNATMVDICDKPATLTREGAFTPGAAGHYYDDALFIFDDALKIVGSPEQLGSPSPAYGVQVGIAAGATVSVSCGATIVSNAEETAYGCVGWKLYDKDDNEVSNGKQTSFVYEHPTPAEYRRLEWQWVEPLTILPIPDQVTGSFAPCRPEFVVSNRLTSATWNIGGAIASSDFDVEYTGNDAAGTANVVAIGKGQVAGLSASGSFNITVTKREDENFSSTDTSARRVEVNGKYVYVFTNAASAQVATAKRSLLLTDCLLVGGGGGGGCTMAGGGGAGGVTNISDISGIVLAKGGDVTVTVGAGGNPSGAQGTKGGNGGTSSIVFGVMSASVAGGGGGGSWASHAGAAGASGGGGTQAGAGGAGIAGIGFDGAAGAAASTSKAGGGGGAGHAGYQAANGRAGYGGEGVSNNITGAWVVYGGGGGGGGSANGWGGSDFGFGGLGGGGNGGRGSAGDPGTDGLGGGGGGGGWTGGNQPGGKGGAGAVIFAVRAVDFEIELIPDQYLEAGGCFPEPVVRYGETLLVKDTDYTVAYADNTTAGPATITATGIGTYAGKVGYASFYIFKRYFAKPTVAAEGDGTSWATAMSVTNLFATIGSSEEYTEAWIAAGTVSAPSLSITNNSALTIRGGFAGTETTLAERPEGTLTVFDGENTAKCLLKASTGEDSELVLDRLKFYRAKENGFIKTGTGSLRVIDSVVEGNGKDADRIYGRGMNVGGGGIGALVVSNCVFKGNVRRSGVYTYGGFGIYVNNFKKALVEDTLFVTNGYSIAAPGASGNCGADGGFGSAMRVIDTPVTVRRCRFAGNVSPLWKNYDSGGVLILNGACGGSVIDHCVFVGNTDRASGQASGDINTGGALVVRLSNAAGKVKVQNCTFAYNIAHGHYSAGGISVAIGDVDIDNSIFWKNTRARITTAGYGSDVQVSSGSTATIRNSLVTTLDGTALAGAGLTVDEATVFAADDAKLVTTTADFTNLLTTTSSAIYYNPSKSGIYEILAAMDVHLKSPAGYVVNGGAAGPATTDYSPAIDLGDPKADYSNEPEPNGERLNLGAFGNTAEASLTAIGQPEATVEVTFPDGMTRPVVRVTMGLESGTAYNATVHVYCSTNGSPLANQGWDNVGNGRVLEFALPYYLANGDAFNVLVSISAPNASPVEYRTSETVNGNYPPFYGKGGGPNVIHVRAGANCLMDGTSWTDAYPSLDAAFASTPDASKTEVWLAVSNDYMPQQGTIASSLTIRGGFAGVENSADERTEGEMTRLDGNNVYRTMNFSVGSGATLTIERIRFSHSVNSELNKAGAGNLTVRDCWFTDCVQSGSFSGRGIAASGGTNIISNCKFTNLIGPVDSNENGGDGIYLNSCAAAYIDDCLFVTNGLSQFVKTKAWQARHKAAAAWVNATPAIFRNCRFAANMAAMHDGSGQGGILRFTGASGGSKLVNCAIVGNSDTQGSQSSATITEAGAIVCNMATANATLDIENCTIAYNLTQGQKTAAGITVVKGTVNVKDSVVYGNFRGLETVDAGSDIEVKANGTLNLAYSLVTGLTSNYIHAVEGGTLNFGVGILTVDPLLATTTNDFHNLMTYQSASPQHWYLPNEVRGTCAVLDVHPRTRTGYIKDGVLIRDPERVESPTIDKGDPTSDYSKEPQLIGIGGNGGRVNLGFSGNTPEAALTRRTGSVYYLR